MERALELSTTGKRMDVRTETYENFPEYMVSYAFYGDTDGEVDEYDIRNYENWMIEEENAYIVDFGEERFFSNNPEFGLPCTCVSATFAKIRP